VNKLNLGCGTDVRPGWVNVDLVELPGVDVVHNLVFLPYPFEDNSADEVRMIDVVEHLPNYTPDWKPMIPALMDELYRILKPGGLLFIQVPRYDAEFLPMDPTHVRGFHERSFDFFDPETRFGQSTGFYSHAKFQVSVNRLSNLNLQFEMIKR
jgi:predicted SAM-dependent methyltransferase